MTFCSLVMISVLSTPRPGAAHPDHSAPGLGSRFSLMTPSVRSSVDYCNCGTHGRGHVYWDNAPQDNRAACFSPVTLWPPAPTGALHHTRRSVGRVNGALRGLNERRRLSVSGKSYWLTMTGAATLGIVGVVLMLAVQ